MVMFIVMCLLGVGVVMFAGLMVVGVWYFVLVLSLVAELVVDLCSDGFDFAGLRHVDFVVVV